MRGASASGRWFRINLWLHRWTSLIVTVPFLILCLTGAILIFHEEIDHLLGTVPESRVMPAGQSPRYDESITEVLAANPGQRIMSIGVDPEHHPGLMLIAAGPEGDPSFDAATILFTDLASGQLAGDPIDGMTLTGFLLELHAQWFLGPVGELIGAFIALLVLISVVSGLVVYAPYAKRVLFGVLRKGRGSRLLQLDLHNFIGVVVTGWLLVVTLTGFLLGFATLATGIWQMTALAEYRDDEVFSKASYSPETAAPLSKVMSAANAAAPPGWQVTNVIYPGTDFSAPAHHTVLLTGGEGIEQSLFKVLIVEAQSGEVATTLQMPLYFKAILLSEPLHFGDYGGLPLKILWTLCTFLTFFITANGAWLWWDRRRRRVGRTRSVEGEYAV